VRGLVPTGTSNNVAHGIYVDSSARITMRRNDVKGDESAGGVGIYCNSTLDRARDNIVNGFVTGLTGCGDVSGNDITP
jgi:tetrahydrodipicolinate N-succinyltransferase